MINSFTLALVMIFALSDFPAIFSKAWETLLGGLGELSDHQDVRQETNRD